MNTKQLDEKFVAHTYARFPLEIVRGKGSLAWDEQGRQYIDLGTGIAVTTFGYSDESWIAAVTEQLGKVQHTSNYYYTAPGAKLAQALCQATGMEKVFFGNSGAEANECAIKAARKWGALHKGPEHYNIITLKNSFHGRTLATLAATGQDVFHSQFLPMPEGFLYADPADPDSLRRLAAERPAAAIMFEPVQGEGGVVPLSREFIKAMAETAREHDLLLIADEIQTGNGRSGSLYAYMQLGLEPDIVTTAKGLGGGLPIGACMLGRRPADVFTYGDHGSTFGANPVSCAGALNILSRLDEATLAGVRERSARIFSALEGSAGIRSVTGMGLMVGLETEKPAKDVAAACLEKGVLVLTAKEKVRLLPALNIPMDLLDRALDVLRAVCAS